MKTTSLKKEDNLTQKQKMTLPKNGRQSSPKWKPASPNEEFQKDDNLEPRNIRPYIPVLICGLIDFVKD